jgi:hypothetical protein
MVVPALPTRTARGPSRAWRRAPAAQSVRLPITSFPPTLFLYPIFQLYSCIRFDPVAEGRVALGEEHLRPHGPPASQPPPPRFSAIPPRRPHFSATPIEHPPPRRSLSTAAIRAITQRQRHGARCCRRQCRRRHRSHPRRLATAAPAASAAPCGRAAPVLPSGAPRRLSRAQRGRRRAAAATGADGRLPASPPTHAR